MKPIGLVTCYFHKKKKKKEVSNDNASLSQTLGVVHYNDE